MSYDNDIRHHSGQNLLWTHEAQNILTTVMTNIVVDKSADNAKPHSSDTLSCPRLNATDATVYDARRRIFDELRGF